MINFLNKSVLGRINNNIFSFEFILNELTPQKGKERSEI